MSGVETMVDRDIFEKQTRRKPVALVADAHEAFRQGVEEEPAQELRRHERHLALPVAVGAILPAEGDALA